MLSKQISNQAEGSCLCWTGSRRVGQLAKWLYQQVLFDGAVCISYVSYGSSLACCTACVSGLTHSKPSQLPICTAAVTSANQVSTGEAEFTAGPTVQLRKHALAIPHHQRQVWQLKQQQEAMGHTVHTQDLARPEPMMSCRPVGLVNNTRVLIVLDAKATAVPGIGDTPTTPMAADHSPAASLLPNMSLCCHNSRCPRGFFVPSRGAHTCPTPRADCRHCVLYVASSVCGTCSCIATLMAAVWKLVAKQGLRTWPPAGGAQTSTSIDCVARSLPQALAHSVCMCVIQ